jgi:RHS repeat-associated protein
MTKYTYTVGPATDIGILTWNTNGTLKTLAITDGLNAGGTQTCNFTYDDVVRILTDNCGAVWNQSYTYSDQYNNFSKSGSSNWNPGYSTTNNHITGATYDSDGQVTYDKNNSFAWDGYHSMITANSGAALGSCGSAGVTCVTYDAFGRPVERNVAGTFTEFLYSPLGLTATMSGQTTSNLRLPLPGGGSLNSTSANNVIYHPDWLGSARLATNTGTTVLLDTAYTPYGEKYATFGTNPQNFTGDYQDMYAGLFDTLFREFDVASGSRWLSPDPAHASWNAYAYPTNPNSQIDPSGLRAEQDYWSNYGGASDPGSFAKPWSYDGLSHGCNLDGADVPCGLVTEDSTLTCQGGDCGVFGSHTGSNQKSYKFLPGVNGPIWLGPNGEELDNPPTEVGLGFLSSIYDYSLLAEKRKPSPTGSEGRGTRPRLLFRSILKCDGSVESVVATVASNDSNLGPDLGGAYLRASTKLTPGFRGNTGVQLIGNPFSSGFTGSNQFTQNLSVSSFTTVSLDWTITKIVRHEAFVSDTQVIECPF